MFIYIIDTIHRGFLFFYVSLRDLVYLALHKNYYTARKNVPIILINSLRCGHVAKLFCIFYNVCVCACACA